MQIRTGIKFSSIFQMLLFKRATGDFRKQIADSKYHNNDINVIFYEVFNTNISKISRNKLRDIVITTLIWHIRLEHDMRTFQTT